MSVFWVLVLFICCAASITRGSPLDLVQVVNLRSDSPPGIRIAVQAVAGLYNRNPTNDTVKVFTVYDDNDVWWLTELLHVKTTDFVELDPSFWLVKFGASQFQYLVYDLNEITVLPTVITLAGVLNLIPVSQQVFDALKLMPSEVEMNVTGRWSTANSGMDAVKFSMDYLGQTSSLAIQPGTTISQGHLVDWIVKEKLFVTYLEDGCIPFTAEHSLLQEIVDKSPWERPIRVYGYNSQHPVFGGDLFEAETNCINTLGQIATEHARNLAFWSTREQFAPQEALVQKPAAPIAYNASKTYVALVYGDMDNIDISQSFGKDHMVYRASKCLNRDDCFPITWTISPNLIDMAPMHVRWYFSQASNADWFIMPPSGTLYAYPSQMPVDVQKLYIQRQNAQANVLNSSGAVHWEFMLTWNKALDEFFPLYANDPSTQSANAVHAFFLNNAPWVFPIMPMQILGETYRFYGNPQDPDHSIVVFKPTFNWCGDCPSGGLNLTSAQVADRLNALPAGSVQYVYTIQNTDISRLFELPDHLAEHVELVGYQQLIDLARQRQKLHH
jgi:hypothetical protein